MRSTSLFRGSTPLEDATQASTQPESSTSAHRRSKSRDAVVSQEDAAARRARRQKRREEEAYQVKGWENLYGGGGSKPVFKHTPLAAAKAVLRSERINAGKTSTKTRRTQSPASTPLASTSSDRPPPSTAPVSATNGSADGSASRFGKRKAASPCTRSSPRRASGSTDMQTQSIAEEDSDDDFEVIDFVPAPKRARVGNSGNSSANPKLSPSTNEALKSSQPSTSLRRSVSRPPSTGPRSPQPAPSPAAESRHHTPASASSSREPSLSRIRTPTASARPSPANLTSSEIETLTQSANDAFERGLSLADYIRDVVRNYTDTIGFKHPQSADVVRYQGNLASLGPRPTLKDITLISQKIPSQLGKRLAPILRAYQSWLTRNRFSEPGPPSITSLEKANREARGPDPITPLTSEDANTTEEVSQAIDTAHEPSDRISDARQQPASHASEAPAEASVMVLDPPDGPEANPETRSTGGGIAEEHAINDTSHASIAGSVGSPQGYGTPPEHIDELVDEVVDELDDGRAASGVEIAAAHAETGNEQGTASDLAPVVEQANGSESVINDDQMMDRAQSADAGKGVDADETNLHDQAHEEDRSKGGNDVSNTAALESAIATRPRSEQGEQIGTDSHSSTAVHAELDAEAPQLAPGPGSEGAVQSTSAAEPSGTPPAASPATPTVAVESLLNTPAPEAALAVESLLDTPAPALAPASAPSEVPNEEVGPQRPETSGDPGSFAALTPGLEVLAAAQLGSSQQPATHASLSEASHATEAKAPLPQEIEGMTPPVDILPPMPEGFMDSGQDPIRTQQDRQRQPEATEFVARSQSESQAEAGSSRVGPSMERSTSHAASETPTPTNKKLTTADRMKILLKEMAVVAKRRSSSYETIQKLKPLRAGLATPRTVADLVEHWQEPSSLIPWTCLQELGPDVFHKKASRHMDLSMHELMDRVSSTRSVQHLSEKPYRVITRAVMEFPRIPHMLQCWNDETKKYFAARGLPQPTDTQPEFRFAEPFAVQASASAETAAAPIASNSRSSAPPTSTSGSSRADILEQKPGVTERELSAPVRTAPAMTQTRSVPPPSNIHAAQPQPTVTSSNSMLAPNQASQINAGTSDAAARRQLHRLLTETAKINYACQQLLTEDQLQEMVAHRRNNLQPLPRSMPVSRTLQHTNVQSSNQATYQTTLQAPRPQQQQQTLAQAFLRQQPQAPPSRPALEMAQLRRQHQEQQQQQQQQPPAAQPTQIGQQPQLQQPPAAQLRQVQQQQQQQQQRLQQQEQQLLAMRPQLPSAIVPLSYNAKQAKIVRDATDQVYSGLVADCLSFAEHVIGSSRTSEGQEQAQFSEPVVLHVVDYVVGVYRKDVDAERALGQRSSKVEEKYAIIQKVRTAALKVITLVMTLSGVRMCLTETASEALRRRNAAEIAVGATLTQDWQRLLTTSPKYTGIVSYLMRGETVSLGLLSRQQRDVVLHNKVVEVNKDLESTLEEMMGLGNSIGGGADEEIFKSECSSIAEICCKHVVSIIGTS